MPTTTEAAEILGCDRSTITRLAKRHGIGSRIGPILYFSAEDIERLRPLIRSGPGNPQIAGESARGVAARLKKRAAN
jgi:excisionase family DNA binding protein